MPSFPRFTAGTSPSGPPIARAQNIGALVRTSDLERWQGISAIGQAIQATSGLAFQAYQHRQNLDNKIESGKATQKIKDVASLIEKARSGFNPTIDQLLPDDPDYLEQGPTFNTDIRDGFDKEDANEFLKKTNKIISGIRSPEVQANIRSWRDENTLALLGPASSANRRVLQDFHVTEIDKLRVSAAENGDIAVADYYVDLMDDNQLITHGKAKVLKKNNKVIADTSVTTAVAQVMLDAAGRQATIDWVMSRDIDIEIKKDVVSDINFQVAQQKLASEQQIEKIQQGYLLELEGEKLSPDDVKKNIGITGWKIAEKWLGDIDAQNKERLEGKPPTDYDTFDAISYMIDDYADSERDPDRREEIDQAISDAIKGRKIPVSGEAGNAITLRSRLSAMSDPDDIMSRSDVVGGMNTIKELKKLNIDFVTDSAKGTPKEQAQQILDAHYKWQKILNDYKKEIKGSKDLTAEDVEKITKQMTQQKAEEAAQTYLDRYLGFWGGYYRYISGYEAYKRIREKIKPKESEEDLTDLTDEELEAIIRRK